MISTKPWGELEACAGVCYYHPYLDEGHYHRCSPWVGQWLTASTTVVFSAVRASEVVVGVRRFRSVEERQAATGEGARTLGAQPPQPLVEAHILSITVAVLLFLEILDGCLHTVLFPSLPTLVEVTSHLSITVAVLLYPETLDGCLHTVHFPNFPTLVEVLQAALLCFTSHLCTKTERLLGGVCGKTWVGAVILMLQPPITGSIPGLTHFVLQLLLQIIGN